MEQLFGAIPSVLSGLGPNAGVDRAVVFAAWMRCAGVLLCARTAPLDFFENRLVIAVEDETWHRHLEELSPQMLVKINRTLDQGSVKFIEFRVDRSAAGTNRDGADAPTDESPAQVTPSLTAAAEAITDEHLRDRFLSAASTYLARQKRG